MPQEKVDATQVEPEPPADEGEYTDAEFDAEWGGSPDEPAVAPDVDPKFETIALVCHEANKVWCAAHGDFSQPDWEYAPDWQRKSAIDGVLFHLHNPDVGPDASHNNWLAHKVADGWTFGHTKNPETKQHPCMVPFYELPPEQQAKDRLFKAICHALLWS